MRHAVALIGYGEAGQTFLRAGKWNPRIFDRQMVGRPGLCHSAAEALAGATVALSLVTADQALAAAHVADGLDQGAFWLDMNSIAPQTKQAAATVIAACGGRYVDVAIMAPVNPDALAVPLLVSGPDVAEACTLLRALGFKDVKDVGLQIGRASTIKMVRSVIVKGSEALTAECLEAAERAGVTDAVLDSLGAEWRNRADYILDRMILHGRRRAAEMDEVVTTLEALGVEPLMSRGTAIRQRAIGQRDLTPVPVGLAAKLQSLAS